MTGLCAWSVGSGPPLSSREAISGPGRKRRTREGEQNAAGRKRERWGGCGARGTERDGKSGVALGCEVNVSSKVGFCQAR